MTAPGNTTSELCFARFIDVLNALNRDTMHLLDSTYHPAVRFQDPVHCIEGLSAFRLYLEGLYAHVAHCHFKVRHHALQGDTAFIAWTMELRHERFRPKEPLYLDGMSMVVFDAAGLIVRHEDSFDLGAMLYERVPIIGALNRRIKRALQ
jgi:hypothetical protein